MAYSSLTELFSAIAGAIREKTGTGGMIAANSFPAEIAKIETGSGVDPNDATAAAGDILGGKTAYIASGKTTGTLKMAQGTVTLTKAVTSAAYETITHNLGAVPSVILLWVENTPAYDGTSTYNIVCGYALNFASDLIPGVRANKSAAQCINSSGGAAGDTTSATSTVCVADQITATTFRLRVNGASRCWANGAQIHWVAMAL